MLLHYLIVFFVSMVPLIELRGAIPFSPFSRHQPKNFPITGLSAPQISTFLAKK